MIKYIIQEGLFEYHEIDDKMPDTTLNMITGKNLMEVYYWMVPVFRCNMGHSIEDDILFCRINYKDKTGIFTQYYRDAKRRSGTRSPDEVFAGNAIFNFCKAFDVQYDEISNYLKGRRSKDCVKSKI